MRKLRIAVGMIAIQLVVLLNAAGLFAQEGQTVYYGKRYLDINIKSIDKFNNRTERQQKRALSKLVRKEKRFAKRLQRKDSAGYSRYQQQELSFDSISKLNEQDISADQKFTSRNSEIDSLKRVKGFLEKTDGDGTGNQDGDLAGYDQKLNSQQNRLTHNKHIQDLILKRTKELQGIGANSKLKGAGLKSIAKCTYYSSERTKILKQISDEPSSLEERSLEFLEGEEGFNRYLKGPDDGLTGMNNKGLDATALEKMGYQSKRQMNAQMQSKLGSNASGIQQKMSGSVQNWQDKTQKLVVQKDNVKQKAKQVKDSKKSIRDIGRIERPAFKVNPMKAQPFWRRVEKQYNWQTTRATLDGAPATIQGSAMFGFKHTPKLTYGVGLTPVVGLGRNWNNIKLSFEGVGLRTYAEQKLVYGFGLYGGYERTYKPAAFTGDKNEANFTPNKHNTAVYHEAVMLGLTKSYNINEKWNGSLQVLYDVWWKDKGLRSPIVIRFATIKSKNRP